MAWKIFGEKTEKNAIDLSTVLEEAARISKEQPILRKRELKDVLGKEFFNVFYDALSVYRTSEYIEKLAHLEQERDDVKQIGMGTVTFQDTYYIELLGRFQHKVAHHAYAIGRAMKNPLMDYAYYVIDSGIGNNVGIVKMRNLSAYTRHFDLNQVPQKAKDRLCDSVLDLAKIDVSMPLTGLMYSEKKKDFKLLEYDGVRVQAFDTYKQKDEYIAAVQARLNAGQ